MNRNTPQYQSASEKVRISHFTEKGHDISGVVHVGTNDGYEFQWYRDMGIEYFMGFEPLPLAIKRFAENYPSLETGKEFFFPFALGSKIDTVNLFQTTGDGQGSSVLHPTKEYKDQHPEYKYIESHKINVFTFEFIASQFNLEKDMEVNFDCLVVDTQGTELEVLKGMGNLLSKFKFLNIECSEKPVYYNSASAIEIIDFLNKKGFKQDSPIEEHNDIFFIRQDI